MTRAKEIGFLMSGPVVLVETDHSIAGLGMKGKPYEKLHQQHRFFRHGPRCSRRIQLCHPASGCFHIQRW